MKAVSLFSGVGGFDLALERNGVEVVATCEIDKHAQKILTRHFPKAQLFSDVTQLTGQDLFDAGFNSDGIIVGGFPCQPFSVAGKRGGVDDELGRGTLFWEIMRLVKETQPRYLLLENVPGLLSIEKGDTLRQMLDLINSHGYLVDLDILDAQFFGVPQRRRRVFIQCERAEIGLRTRTLTSAITTFQMITELSLAFLEEQKGQSNTDVASSDSSKTNFVDSLRKRMNLLSPTLNSSELTLLLQNCNADLVKSVRERNTSEPVSGSLLADSIGMAVQLSDTGTESVFTNTDLLWKNISDDLCEAMRWFTTSTKSKPITDSQIFTFSQAVLHISRLIILLTKPPINCWKLELLLSTALKECTNYARQTDSDLFSDLERSHDWDAFLREAANPIFIVGHLGDDGRASAEILAIAEGRRGYLAKGQQTGKATARKVGTSP